MALWLVRAGDYEDNFLSDENNDGYIFCVFPELSELAKKNLSDFPGSEDIKQWLLDNNKDWPEKKAVNIAAQISAFAHKMKPGDWVAVPRPASGTIAIGEIKGDYQYNNADSEALRHRRPVEWRNNNIDRNTFKQPHKNSLGAYSRICRLQANNIEEEFRSRFFPEAPEIIYQLDDKSQSEMDFKQPELEEIASDENTAPNPVSQASDSILDRIREQYNDPHEFEVLIGTILEAKGYKVKISKPGKDGGVDVLAASGPLGFGETKIVVQVKNKIQPAGRKELDELIGCMRKFGANQALFVSSSGFNLAVKSEIERQHFFEVRLWDMEDLVQEIISCYEQLPYKIKDCLRLKQVWVAEPM